MKKNNTFLLKVLSTFLIIGSLASCGLNQDNMSNTEPSTPNSEDSNIVETITLDEPVLNLDTTTGVVTWSEVKDADFYRYYINDSQIKETTFNQIELKNGESISVSAESNKENFLSSDWSNPVVYYAPVQETKYITIHFQGTTFESVSLLKGSTYSPKNPTREYYTFDQWYLDPFYQVPFTTNYVFNEDTILYANFIENDLIKDTTYWIKSSPEITSSIISSTTSSTGWRHIPLKYDEKNSKLYKKNMFSATISASNISASSPAYFVIMDGLVADDGRSYFKNGDLDFSITSNGSYKILFSTEYTWTLGNNKVNCVIEHLNNSSQPNDLYNDRKYPQFALDSTTELDTVSLKLDSHKEQVYWEPTENATAYEYIIDNGSKEVTTSNVIPLYRGSHIVVRAITTKPGFMSSRWSLPVKQVEPKYDEFVFAYFHGSNRPAMKVEYGKSPEKPTNNPVKPGYKFDNWYSELSCKTLFDFNKPLYENVVIYPKWTYLNEINYVLYNGSKTKIISNFEVYPNYSYNEFKTFFEVSDDLTVYVKNKETNKFFGPYVMNESGKYKMYFSEDHKWDYGTQNERNAYWELDMKTFFFTNNYSWSTIKAYAWDSNGDYLKAWPGTTMTYFETNSYGQDIYEIKLSSSYIGLIFNNGTDQTVDIDIANKNSGTGWYISGDKVNNKYPVGEYTL